MNWGLMRAGTGVGGAVWLQHRDVHRTGKTRVQSSCGEQTYSSTSQSTVKFKYTTSTTKNEKKKGARKSVLGTCISEQILIIIGFKTKDLKWNQYVFWFKHMTEARKYRKSREIDIDR